MITSIAEFISSIRDDCKKWDTKHGPWFRGEPDVETPLLPKLYRKKDDGTNHDENQLIQTFRIKAPSLSSEQVPDRANIDQWLFLAQHVGLPTRLLDWTENALLALWFAIQHKKSVVWMLNPIEMNNLSITGGTTDNDKQGFPLTWGHLRAEEGVINIGFINIQGAYSHDKKDIPLPVAIIPTYIHSRMHAQRSCFTVHGKEKKCICDLIPGEILKKYQIDPDARDDIESDLRMLGIQCSSAFPDLDGLAKELTDLF